MMGPIKRQFKLALTGSLAMGSVVTLSGCSSRESGQDSVLATTTQTAERPSSIQPAIRDEELRKRVIFGMKNLGVVGADRCSKGWDVQAATTKRLRAATDESLKAPTLAPSQYFFKPDKEIMVAVSWIEDKPTLHQVTVINPRTRKEVTIEIPPKYLDQMNKFDNGTVLFGYPATIPMAALGGVSQDDTLLIRKTGRGGADGEVPCYACLERSTTRP